MKVSDYIIEFVASLGVDKVFCVTGGGAMHMNNSLGTSDKLDGVFMLHEQGASIAAESYARIHEGYGCCLVTSGPGATNALTGLVGAYIDSIPVIFISGQAKCDDLVGNQGIRQFGIQEVDVISMVKSYTKYAVSLRDPKRVKYELSKAACLAVEGRPGPVWLEFPLDIQASNIEPDECDSYFSNDSINYEAKDSDVYDTIKAINGSKRPVIILGHGVRLSHSYEKARVLIEKLNIPVLTSWNGVDLLENDHPLYFGRPGAVGQRAANFIQQTADLVITLGTRLNLLSTGYNYDSFLGNSYHIMVDIDEAEMNKKSVHPDLKVVCDVSSFIDKMLSNMDSLADIDRSEWITRCKYLFEKYPNRIPEQQSREGFVSTYDIVEAISNEMNENDIYQFTSSGTSVDIAMKVLKLKKGQRAFLTKGLASMGYDIPASIGSCIAGNKRRTICVTGDGSSAMNMQELEVIRRLNLPVKLFIADNQGYSMIYGSQMGNFKRLTGCTKENGLTLPDMGRIAEAMDITCFRIESDSDIVSIVKKCLDFEGPCVCVFNADITQKILPKQTNYMRDDGQMASRPLEDMTPLLDRDELDKILNFYND